jgi:hypothetical protein
MPRLSYIAWLAASTLAFRYIFRHAHLMIIFAALRIDYISAPALLCGRDGAFSIAADIDDFTFSLGHSAASPAASTRYHFTSLPLYW